MSQCIQIVLIDDMMVEQPEDFYVTLQRTPDLSEQIQLDIQWKRVTILERDSELVGTWREEVVCLEISCSNPDIFGVQDSVLVTKVSLLVTSTVIHKYD